MEILKRHDIAAFGEALMVVVESDHLPPDAAIVVIPLLKAYPTVPHLNPLIYVEGETYVLATRLIAAVRRSKLRRAGSALMQADEITRAVDVLMGGV